MRSGMIKIEGLNSLRFFAFLSVYIFHTVSTFKYGYIGVDFFFVLSSFLLTLLALKEYENTSGFSKINFFVRRSLRIFPLYFLILFFSFVILPFLAADLNYSISLPQEKWMYLFFLSNYDYRDCIFALKFLWSISAEEQFYLLFLIVSPLIIKRPYVIIALFLLIYLFFLLYTQTTKINTYTHTIIHFPNFSAGIICAHLYFKKINFKKNVFLVLAICGGILFLTTEDIAFNVLISVIFGCVILLTIQYAHFIKKNLIFNFTEFWGNYTYGLYIYSGFVITFNSKFLYTENVLLNFFTSLVVLFVVAYLSYHAYEKQFLKLKKAYQPKIKHPD